MDSQQLQSLTRSLRVAASEGHGTEFALLTLCSVLEEVTSYKVSGPEPRRSVQDFVHWILLTLKSARRPFGITDQLSLPISDGCAYTLWKRVRESDGKRYVELRTPDCDNVRLQRPASRYEYDLCISFAGEERNTAEQIASEIKKAFPGAKVFYDDFEKWNLWGHDLATKLHDVYSAKSRACLPLISESYLRKPWTRYELRAALTRLVNEGSGYIWPVIVNTAKPPPELAGVSYLELGPTSIEEIGQHLAQRIWEQGYSDWLTEDEIVEALRQSFSFSVVVDEFKTAILNSESEEEKTLRAILGLMYATEAVTVPVRSFYEFLLFEFEPISNLFEGSDTYLALPPDGFVRRHIWKDLPLLMTFEYWEPRFREAQQKSPMFSEEL